MELGTISCRLFSDWRVRRQSGSVRAVSIAHPLLARIPATRSASLMTYIPHRLGGQTPPKEKERKKYTTSRRSPHFKQERIAVAKQKILWTQKGEKMVVGKAVADSTYSDCELSKEACTPLHLSFSLFMSHRRRFIDPVLGGLPIMLKRPTGEAV